MIEQDEMIDNFLHSNGRFLQARSHKLTEVPGGTQDSTGCIHSLDWITGLDYWTQKFLDMAHKRGYADN